MLNVQCFPIKEGARWLSKCPSFFPPSQRYIASILGDLMKMLIQGFFQLNIENKKTNHKT